MFGFMRTTKGAAHRMSEISGAYNGGAVGVMTGMICGTKVATNMGWRDVSGVVEGDEVLSFDNGLQVVTRVTRTLLWTGEQTCPTRFWPLEIEAGVIGNEQPIRLLPNQGLLLESDRAEETYGDPFALLTALALEELAGVHRICPNEPIEVVTLHFADDQVIFSSSGALLFCAAARDLVEDAACGAPCDIYQMLSVEQAETLLQGEKPEIAAPAAPMQHEAQLMAVA